MSKKILIAVRLDSEIVETFNRIIEKNPSCNRSLIMNTVLSTILSCSSEEVIRQILCTYRPYENGYTVQFIKNHKPL